MMRFAAFALLLVTATSAVAQTAPVLRPTVLVSGDLVRIGDLVERAAPAKADIAVFRAPDLGETGSVKVSAVLEALRPHDVAGVQTQGLSEISVTRASRIIGTDEIKARIAEIAAERLRVADAGQIMVVTDAPPAPLHRDPSETGPLMPVRAFYEPRSGRFDLVFRSGAGQVRVTGTAQEAQDAVVLKRAVARGDVLRDSDIAVEKRPKSELQGEIVHEAAAAIGMALQQTLRPGQVLRSSDLAKPQLIKRGEPVMLLYEVPGIVLTARGKSEDAGSLGDTINVLNVQSKRVVQGTVTAHGQVTITSLTPRVAAVADPEAARNRIAARNAQTKAE
jgi:flagella basal body P-ring formation protein FlgA